jgi:Methyltransferase domain
LRRRARRLRGHIGRLRTGGRRRAQRVSVVSRFPRDGVGAEIGVWKGDFSSYLLRIARPARLHLIDPWHFNFDPDDERGRRAQSQENMDAMHDHVRRRFARQIARGRVVLHRARSDEVAPELESLDWVYLDGNHTYEGVRDDLEAYFALLRPGGVLAGDDYGMPGWWGDGVREAVDEFVAGNGCAVTITGHQFLIRKPAASH